VIISCTGSRGNSDQERVVVATYYMVNMANKPIECINLCNYMIYKSIRYVDGSNYESKRLYRKKLQQKVFQRFVGLLDVRDDSKKVYQNPSALSDLKLGQSVAAGFSPCIPQTQQPSRFLDCPQSPAYQEKVSGLPAHYNSQRRTG